MQTLSLTWHDQTVEFKPSFDLFMRIEEKVAFNRIANEFNKASQGNVIDLPMSHMAWLLYCCLRHAGVAVRTPMEAHQALIGEKVPGFANVLNGLIVAYYGAEPQKLPKKKLAKPRKPSPPSSRSSKSGTALP